MNVVPSPSQMIWVEAEHFADYGGWTCDAQFMDQMGSPYLLAVGMGAPVTDAVTFVEPAASGPYRLWVRSRDWFPGHGPGPFQVLVNGRPTRGAETPFGISGEDGWRWENGGVCDLSEKTELRLRDQSGYYGRCDVIALCADLTWVPPAADDGIAALRERFGGVSERIEESGAFDVIVAGGGLAGCTAAVAAARGGARTLLLQNRSVLGGNASTEILVPPVGSWPHGQQDPFDPHETGLIEEIRTEGLQRTEEARFYAARLHRWVTSEPNLTLFLDTHITTVEKAEKADETRHINAVVTQEVPSGQRRRFSGRVFVDCTGDAAVGVAAGAEYRHGREPRSLYNESLAPLVADATTMGNSLKYFSLPTGTRQPFASPSWVMSFPTCASFPFRRHPVEPAKGIDWQWVLELGGTRDTYADKEAIRDDLLRLIYGIWNHLKNHCELYKDAVADHRLAWVGHVCGMRESRRLIGDHVLTENDVADQVLFPDRIAYGGWGLDDHYSEGFLHQGEPSIHPYKGLLHSIPYRSLYSRNVANLLMAGRCLSASHVGMGATRVMLTCAVIAQAAGTAAALCIRHSTTPRGVYQDHLEALQQQLLKDGAYLIGLPNADAGDLARTACLTASSESVSPSGEPLRAKNVINGCARLADGKQNAWKPEENAHGPHWLELSWREPQTVNVAHVTFQTRALAPHAFSLEIDKGDGWERIACVTENHHCRRVLSIERTLLTRLRVVLSEPAGVCEVRVYDEPATVVETVDRVNAMIAVPDEDTLFPWGTTDARLEVSSSRPSPGTDVNAANGFLAAL